MRLLYRRYFCYFMLLSSMLCLQPLSSSAQNFTEINHAYWYRPDAPFQSRLLVWQKSPDSLEVVALVSLKGPQAIEDYNIYLHPRKQLDSTEIFSIPHLLPAPYRKEGNRHFFRTSLPLSDSMNYLLLEATQVGTDSLALRESYWSAAYLHPDVSFPPPTFFLTQQDRNLPLLRSYLPAEKPLRLEGNAERYTVFQYKEAFEPAASPMAPPGAASSSLDVDSTFTLPADSLFQLKEEGLYFFQRDTSSLLGLGIRLTNPYFPEVGTLQDFAGPIRYLSTNEEWRQLEKADFSKKELDRFWLKIAQDKERAKRIIQTYYQQVAEANALFTNYKEGWKTDQGMIYILYGKPDMVQVEAENETWIYRKTANNPEIKFTFVRVKNPFTDKHFVLVRSKNYTKSHYQTVSQWRRGRKTL